MFRSLGAAALLTLAVAPVLGQTPQPFPRPDAGRTTAVSPPAPTPRAPQTPAAVDEPTATSLGLPLYPAAQFIASYDAGAHGQRYYLFGVRAPFADIVSYYRSQLGARGDQVFREPPTHMFEVGRFREESMVFPPGVTVKDWTWGGSAGYPNTRPGADPERFPTIIMIVPPPR